MSAYSELGQEVTQTFDRVEDIVTGPQLSSSCIYLRVVIDEHIRVTPPGVVEGFVRSYQGASLSKVTSSTLYSLMTNLNVSSRFVAWLLTVRRVAN